MHNTKNSTPTNSLNWVNTEQQTNQTITNKSKSDPYLKIETKITQS